VNCPKAWREPEMGGWGGRGAQQRQPTAAAPMSRPCCGGGGWGKGGGRCCCHGGWPAGGGDKYACKHTRSGLPFNYTIKSGSDLGDRDES